MSVQLKGHPASIRRFTVDTTGGEVEIDPPGETAFVQIYNQDITNVLRIYFNEEDFTANANYIELTILPPRDLWEGPLQRAKPRAVGQSVDPKNPGIWLRSITGDAVACVVFYRTRG